MIITLAHWFVTVPHEEAGEYKDALVAAASVAAVVWTGGLITMQLRNSGIVLIGALDILQNAFMGAILALFVVGVPLRLVVLIVFSFYLIRTTNELAVALTLWRKSDHGATDTVLPSGIFPTSLLVRTSVRYCVYNYLTLVFYCFVILWPTQKVVSIFAWSALFLGMQMLLTRLYGTDDQPTFDREWLIVYALTIVVAIILLRQ